MRAFGQDDAPWGEPVDGAEAARLAERLWLGPRIVARRGWGRLRTEIGEEATDRMVRDVVMTLGVEERLARTLRRVAKVAAELSMPFALLKYAALRLSPDPRVRFLAGSRGASDIDLLVELDRADELQRALLDAGLSEPGVSAKDHHLPLLGSPDGQWVEVHRYVPGVQIAARESVSFGELHQAGLLTRVEAIEGDCWVPVREVLVAHTLVHGLVHHGWLPDSYPLSRVLTDLIELGVVDEGGGAEPWRYWIRHQLDGESVESVLGLCRWLTESGAAEGDSPESTGADLILRHLLAGRLDSDYADSLKLRGVFVTTRGGPRVLQGARALSRALFPTRSELEQIYGTRESRWGLLALRLWRPFDLVVRLGRYWRKKAAVERGRAS